LKRVLPAEPTAVGPEGWALIEDRAGEHPLAGRQNLEHEVIDEVLDCLLSGEFQCGQGDGVASARLGEVLVGDLEDLVFVGTNVRARQ
jgi:hypothetical protein